MISLITRLLFYATLTLALSQSCGNGCFQCNPYSNHCTACVDKYHPTLLGDCVEGEVDNCALYFNSTFCLTCCPTYSLQNNHCVKDYSGCLRNLTSSRCGLCSPELKLVNGTCIGILNCLNSSKTCNQCDQGFTLFGNICIANEDNCLTINRTNGVCVTCKAGFSLMGYQCISLIYYNPNCELYDKVGRCFICKSGYVLHQGICYGAAEIQLIATLNKDYPVNNASNSTVLAGNNAANNTNSSTKIESKPLNIDKYCSLYNGSQCQSCYSNFHLEYNTCKPNNPLCREIYNNGSCKSCYSGYQLQQGNCITAPVDNQTAKATSNGTVNLNPSQQIIDPHCLSSINGLCKLCSLPYVLMNSQCIYPIANCLSYDQNSNCLKCFQGYFLKQNVCYAKDVTCAAYDISGVCIRCVVTYYLINNVCVFPALGFDQRCISYLNSYCTECIAGSYLKDYRCVEVDLHCLKFDYTRLICVSCGPGLLPSGATCI